MPHLTLEYSDNLPVTKQQLAALFQEAHAVMAEIADLNRCKSRAYQLTDYYLGDGDEKSALVYLQVAMLKSPERTEEVKKAVLGKLLIILEKTFLPYCEQLGLRCLPTAEVRDLGSYMVSSAP